MIDTTTAPTVKLIHTNASDEMVIAAARVSTVGADSQDYITTPAEEGKGLIKFLMKNRHGTPFEHNQFCFYVQAGIFVFREFHRHRIGWSYNEESGRYKQLDPLFYVPGPNRPLFQVGKPGAYEMVAGSLDEWLYLTDVLCEAYEAAYAYYERLLARGYARELARLVLPVGINSSMYATCNARSLMAFLSLRTDHDDAMFPSKPQYEIQQVSARLENVFARAMPITYKAWNDCGRVAP